MKSKYKILLIATAAVVTLSFTFSGVSRSSKDTDKKVTRTSKSVNSEPVGGFVSEDKF